MSKKTKVVQTRLDADLVDEASDILEHVGLSVTDFVRVALKKVVNTRSFPLDLSYQIPTIQYDTETIKRIEDMIDKYETGELETVRVTNKQELTDYLKSLNDLED
jgi:DNA-damage-inducible protein J